jgi:phosphopantetheinyl transferase (holo-ACP synthase)
MKAAVLKAIDSEIEKQKNLQGIKRLTQKKKEEIINYSSTIAQLKERYRTL